MSNQIPVTLKHKIEDTIKLAKELFENKTSIKDAIYEIFKSAVLIVEELSKVQLELKGKNKLELALSIVNVIIDSISIPAKLFKFIPVPQFLIKRAIKSVAKNVINFIVNKFNKNGTFKKN